MEFFAVYSIVGTSVMRWRRRTKIYVNARKNHLALDSGAGQWGGRSVCR